MCRYMVSDSVEVSELAAGVSGANCHYVADVKDESLNDICGPLSSSRSFVPIVCSGLEHRSRAT